ncbi:uncharacterized protein LOC115739238 [Rhodamnia argentea]|uniref:Uncharacterized protein LOC115739238 n=1 Tax=Rhodamnia argentea TaxID=178133 RepID=A0A8B8P2K7_9MYRT|nr:uncharacterized protein LOC115739238 [Rhodamnia argentea]
MAVELISAFISEVWLRWNIRGFIILSVLLQISLVLFARIRKQTVDDRIVFLLWLVYLMANWVAVFTVGLISHNQGNLSALSVEHRAEHGAIYAFWASLLLSHFGGADTIVAFSLDDNKLWQRNVVSSIFQVATVLYVFVKVFPNDKSLVIPTMLVLFSSFIKNVEKLLALYLSSLPRLRESILSGYKYRKDAYSKLLEGNFLEYRYLDEEAHLPESVVVMCAYYFFHIFKVFFTDIIFKSDERQMSLEYFHRVSAMDALRVLSVELHFMYEVLHTKALAIRSKWSYIFRFVAFIGVTVAFILFHWSGKGQFLKYDVEVTYVLLFGEIALDVIAMFMLVFSDWTVAGIQYYSTGSSILGSFLCKLVSVSDNMRKPRFATCKTEANDNVTFTVLDTPLIFRRWSESISACNLFSEYFKESPRKMYKHNRCRGIIDFPDIRSFLFRLVEKSISCFHQEKPIMASTKYVSKNPFVKELWIFIFNEVRRKSRNADGPTEVRMIFEARGDLFLQSGLGEFHRGNLLEYVSDVNYEFSILTWHIATEMWYNREKPFTFRNNEREFSKILSDYMLYLFVNQSNVVSAVADIAQVTSSDTLCELEICIRDAIKDVEGLSKMLFEGPFTAFDPTTPLNRGINLAHEMERLEEMKWAVMSGVWVEMLCYAAVHIKGEAHMQVLSTGGELLTFVWLLMAHFGCFYKPGWGIHYNRDSM